MIPDLLTVSELDSYIQLHQKWKNEPEEDFVFNNMILNPSLTSLDGTNPGFSLFDYDATKQVIHSLRMHYLRIRQTYGKMINETADNLPAITDESYYKFKSIDFGTKYGVYTLTPQSLLRFTERLERGGFD